MDNSNLCRVNSSSWYGFGNHCREEDLKSDVVENEWHCGVITSKFKCIIIIYCFVVVRGSCCVICVFYTARVFSMRSVRELGVMPVQACISVLRKHE